MISAPRGRKLQATMGPNSRLQIDPSTLLPSIQSFGELSQFLRGAIADEDSRQFSESMSHLALHTEAIIASLRLNQLRASVAPLLMDLLTVLRSHCNFVIGLEPTWRGLYEYAAYLQALHHFRVLIGQWLLEGGSSSRDLSLTAADFELVAWRTLGEGVLLIDMYEQWAGGALQDDPAEVGAMGDPHIERAIQWWKRLGI